MGIYTEDIYAILKAHVSGKMWPGETMWTCTYCIDQK
jgi:hypothetical protein